MVSNTNSGKKSISFLLLKYGAASVPYSTVLNPSLPGLLEAIRLHFPLITTMF